MNRVTPLLAVAAAALLASPPAGADAQVRPTPAPAPSERPQQPEPRGWLGIDFQWEQRPGEDRPSMVIRQVMRNSPAERAELRTGDQVLSFGGVPADPAAVRSRGAQLRPGEVIVLELARPGDDTARTVRIQADHRPTVVTMGPGGEWVPFNPDTLRALLRLNLDSMQVHLEQFHSDEMQVVFRRMMEEGARTQEMSARLHRELQAHARDRPEGRAGVRLQGVAPSGFDRALVSARVEGAPSLTVFRAGQRVVGGAELTPMNPDLARYFGVAAGVLVVEVLDDTPAAHAGLRGGDVIVRVGGRDITGIPEFRAALEEGYRNPPVPATVIREGREVEVRFPR